MTDRSTVGDQRSHPRRDTRTNRQGPDVAEADPLNAGYSGRATLAARPAPPDNSSTACIAPLVAMQAVLPVMRAQGGGAIVNSATTQMVLPGLGAYAAGEAALNQLSATACTELVPHGITVSTVLPFVTTTEFHRTLRAGSVVPAAAGFPVHSPEQVAAAILDLLRTGRAETSLLPPGIGTPERR